MGSLCIDHLGPGIEPPLCAEGQLCGLWGWFWGGGGVSVANSWAVGLVSSPEHGAWCFPTICPGICVGHRLSTVCFLITLGKFIPKG